MASLRAACLVLLPALLWPGTDMPQTRSEPVPAEAWRGTLRHLTGRDVTIDGKAARLAAGASIRDQRNLIVVPSNLPRDSVIADFLLNGEGQVQRVWLPTAEELARPRKRYAP